MHYFTIKNYYLLYILTTNNISNMISKDTINVNRKYKFNLRRLFMKRKSERMGTGGMAGSGT